MKNIGSRFENLFQKKKKEVGELVDDKEKKAKEALDDQLNKTSQAFQQTKQDVEKVGTEAGMITFYSMGVCILTNNNF